MNAARVSLTVMLTLSLMLGAAFAQTIRIGAVASATGPAAGLGEPEANTFRLLQQQFNEAGGIAGVPVEIIFLDDATETSQAVTNVRRLIQEEEVHAVICCTITSNSLAIIDTVQEAEVPTVSMAASASIIEPVEERFWVFKTPQTDRLMIEGIVQDIQAKGFQSVAFMGLDDAYGEGGLTEFQALAGEAGIEIPTVERHGRNDTNVTPQALRVVSRQPDAVLIWGVDRDSALAVNALRQRGYEGQIYVSHGTGNQNFLEQGGEAIEGTLLPIGPMIVADQLPDDSEIKPVALEYIGAYEAEFGEGTASTFGGHAQDAVKLLELAITQVIEEGADLSDVDAARTAIRDALESAEPYTGVGGVFDFTAEDHLGLDERALVLVEIQDNTWTLAEQEAE